MIKKLDFIFNLFGLVFIFSFSHVLACYNLNKNWNHQHKTNNARLAIVA